MGYSCVIGDEIIVSWPLKVLEIPGVAGNSMASYSKLSCCCVARAHRSLETLYKLLLFPNMNKLTNLKVRSDRVKMLRETGYPRLQAGHWPQAVDYHDPNIARFRTLSFIESFIICHLFPRIS